MRWTMMIASCCSLLPLAAQEPDDLQRAGGTLGVACGAATDDGRPLLWLVHDAAAPDCVVMALRDGKIPYLALGDAAKVDRAWGGVNQSGFAIVVTAVDDLPAGTGGRDNGEFVKQALQSCALVSEFEALLRASGAAGRRTRGNFAAIDAGGTAALFEVGPKAFARFDATGADGAFVRTNGTSAGGGNGKERRARGELLLQGQGARPLSTRFLLQGFVRDEAPAPSAMPDADGYRDDRDMLCGRATRAALVIHGVKAGEAAGLTTMWSLLGRPLFSVAVPLWPAAGAVPRELGGDPKSHLGDLAQHLAATFSRVAADGAPAPQLRIDGLAEVRRVVVFNEAKVLAQVDEAFAGFRKADQPPAPSLLRAAQERITKDAVKWVGDLVDCTTHPAAK